MYAAEGMALGASAGVSHFGNNPMAMSGITYDGKIAGLYDLEETLGSGHFAVVKLARHVFTGAKVAVKVVDKTKLDEVSKAHLFQEVRCMKLVQHPNVVRLYEVIDTQTKLYLVLELGDGGDLYDYIMKHEGGLSEDLARKYFRQILRAITYCHQLHVVHRDLKPENVVFFEKLGVVKLTDFGFSNKFSPGQKLETFCGSLAYSAPEILLGDSYDAPAVDIWSLGVILYMLVCGQPPFEKANDSETLTMIMDCKYTVPPQVSKSCRDLIASMLVRDPKKRATLEHIAADPWLKDNSEFQISEFLPLVSRQELSDEDHTFIIQKMINGNIATKEDIQQALDKNIYNHITATYYLLAEIRLRKRREELANKQNLNVVIPSISSAGSNASDIILKSKESQNRLAMPCQFEEPKSDKRSRKCSIVREEDEDDSSYENVGDSNHLKVTVTRRESISDGRINRSVQKQVMDATVPVSIPTHSSNKMYVSVDETLAQKLNKIDQSNPVIIHKTTDSSKVIANKNVHSKKESAKTLPIQETLQGLKNLTISKSKPAFAAPINTNTTKNPVLTHRRTKLNKIRTPSCSSSEASDDDSKARNKKKLKFVGDTPTRFRMHRRDSHDDSSDSQDQPFPSTGAHGHAANVIKTTNNSNIDNRKNSDQTKTKEHNKSDETRKSSKQSKKTKNTTKKSQHESQNLSKINTGRRFVRESQSLDRITEAQEYEFRQIFSSIDVPHFEQRNSLCNLNSLSVAETKEEYDDESTVHIIGSNSMKINLVSNENEIMAKLTCNEKNHKNKQKTRDEHNFITENISLPRTMPVSGSSCLVSIKKIRRLGKYFPVVNFT